MSENPTRTYDFVLSMTVNCSLDNMSQITSVKIWKDIGYTDGSLDLPPIGHTFKAPDYMFDGPFAPSKDRLFSELQLPVDYLTILDCSYLSFELEMNNSESIRFFGWIDDVKLQSDSDGFPMSIVYWHIDYWMTFGAKAKYGSGYVVRRPHGDSDFYQTYPYNYMKVQETINLTAYDQNYWWVLLVAQVRDSDEVVTGVVFYLYPVFLGINELHVKYGTADKIAPTYYQTITAKFDEHLGLNPESITGAWIMPFCPAKNIVKSGDSEFTSNNEVWQVGDAGAFTMQGITAAAFFDEFRTSIGPNKSTEENPIYVTGFMGDNYGAIPYNMTVDGYTYRLRASATEAVVEFRFDGINSNAEGLCFDLSLPTLDVNSNAWSSYIMSGQRQYDIDQRNMKSVMGLVSGGISNSMMGALVGGAVGSAAGPVGAAVGAMAGLISTAVGANVELYGSNQITQQQEDRLHANQASSIIYSGLGADISKYGRCPALVRMEMDEGSKIAVNDIRDVYGVKYNCPVNDCSTLIQSGGPMQIQNLVVTGDIPVKAKQWIINRFAVGVRIIEKVIE